jgi:hypothetical protein
VYRSGWKKTGRQSGGKNIKQAFKACFFCLML